MVPGRSVVLNGDLGSGKSTVSKLLARRLGIRRISVGELYRDLAAQRGQTALQLNLHAELDDKIDHYVDQLQRDIAAAGEQLIVDSRLAWHFFTDALKVHLIADPTVAAARVLGRPADSVESYASVEEARGWLAARSESERARFLARYGIDKTRLRNYDLVLDTTRATPDEIADRIVAAMAAPPGGLDCYIDPQRIHISRADAGADTVRIIHASSSFLAVGGASLLRGAIDDGCTLVRATLVAEADEMVDGLTCTEYFQTFAR